ncbi:MAG: DNA polymerase III subunit delta [Alistipes sp.]|nr:DNA polymerase III subunit delta [Alistipes sp.]
MAKTMKFVDCVTEYRALMSDIEARRFQPIYLLTGDEGFFIDALCDALSDSILTEAERAFNQVTVYGLDTDAGAVVNLCRQMPMMGAYQVVIVREAQQMSKLDALSHYTSSPQQTTILVVCYKNKEQGKGIDKRTSFYKSCQKNGVVFESVRPRDYEVDAWLNSYITTCGLKITAKAMAMLKEHVGMDLSRMAQEIKKLSVSLPENERTVTDGHIEQYIGLSKEFNTFELNDAVLKQDVARAMRIADHFAHNPKSYPITLTINVLFSLFQQLFLLNYLMWQQRRKGIPLPADGELMREIRVNNMFALKEIKMNVGRWDNRRVFGILGLLREYDAKSKGIDSGGLDGGELLKELLLKIFTIR